MTNLKNAQNGFGIMVIILVLGVVAVLGGVSWTVYQNNKTKSTGATQDNYSNSQQSADSTPAPAVTYLDVKEWGIKLPLSEAIKDGYYTFAGSNRGEDGLPNTAWLGLTSLNDSGCNIAETGPTSSATPVGSIVRVLPTDKDPVKGKLYTELYPNGVTINGYYYTYIIWQNKTCASQDTLRTIDSAFVTAAKGIVKSNTSAN